MNHRLTEALARLDQRTGIHSAARHFLSKEMPTSSGCRQVLGSVAVFLFGSGRLFVGVLRQRESA